MNTFWSALYAVAFASFVWFLHRGLGGYPAPLTRSQNPKRETCQALLLWGVALLVPILRVEFLAPFLDQAIANRTLRELIYLPVLSAPYVALPLYIVLKVNRWTVKDLGLSWKNQSPDVAIAALLFGLVSGFIAFLTNKTVMGAEVFPAAVFILLLYNNSFLEEFYHRGVIQAKLERAVGQGPAILWGGLLFGFTHVGLDLTRLFASQGILAVFLALLLQTMGGWLLGIVYMKTRSLWPGVVCHYLVNWLPGILVMLAS